MHTGHIFGSEQSQSQVPSRLLIISGRHLMKVQLRNMKIEDIGSLQIEDYNLFVEVWFSFLKIALTVTVIIFIGLL